MTTQEATDYLDAAGQLGYGTMFTLAIHCGLRQRELIALKWSDVDMKKPSLTIYAGDVVKEGKFVEYAEKIRKLQLSPEDDGSLQQVLESSHYLAVDRFQPGTRLRDLQKMQDVIALLS